MDGNEKNREPNERTVPGNAPETWLLPGEAADELFVKGYRILQKQDGFRYGTDAVLLSKFAEISENSKVLDIGTGTGILPILLSAKNGTSEFCGLDVVPEMVEMANRSARMNGLENRIRFYQLNVRDALTVFPKRSFDTVVTNPPYKAAGTGIPNDCGAKYIARHEVLCTLEDVVRISADLLKMGGTFFMVQRPDRLCDTLELMRKYKTEPKILTMVHFRPEDPPVMFLVKGVQGGGRELRVTAPVILENGGAGRLSD